MDLVELPISRTAELLRERRISSVELVRAALAVVEQLDPALNAFLRVYPEQALAAALDRYRGLASRATPPRVRNATLKEGAR